MLGAVSTREEREGRMRGLIAAVCAVAVGALGVLLIAFTAADPFTPAAARQVPVVVRTYLPGTGRLIGPPTTRYAYWGGLPAAVLNLTGTRFDGGTYRAAWYDETGGATAYVQGRGAQRFAGPIPATPYAAAPSGQLTFAFGPWDTWRHRFTRIDARARVDVVVTR
jgi:hypothetical protein